MCSEWIRIDASFPKNKGTFWCYPTHHENRYCALYWDGIEFSSGKYKPKGITHYKEIKLEYPKPPEV